MKKSVFALVTGAGKGFGKSISKELAKRKNNLLLIARPGENLRMFGEELNKNHGVEVHCFEVDFLQDHSLNKVRDWVSNYEVDFLVNNAGIGGSNFFEDTDEDQLNAIIQVNIKTLAILTHLLINKLKEHPKAYILNVGSMASCCPIAYKTVYPASKAFVYSFSKSLNVELAQTGISVSVVLPGPIKTNQEVTNRINQQGWWVKAGLWEPEQLAKFCINKTLKGRSVIIPGFINKINWLMLRVLPKRICIPTISTAIRHEILMTKQVV